MAIHIDVLSRLDESSAEDVSRMLERHMERAGERAATALGDAMTRRLKAAKVDDAIIEQFEAMEKRAELAGKAIGTALVGGITAAAVGLVEIGDKFEEINRGLQVTTAATGQALAQLRNDANSLSGTLDVASGNIGNLMGQISSQLRMGAGEALKSLTGDIATVAERTKTSTDALVGALVQMKVPGDQAAETLASLVKSGQEFGGVLPQIATGIAQYGNELRDLGLNAQQSGHFIGELAGAHIPLTTAMKGLEAAQKANETVAKNTGKAMEPFPEFVQRAAASMEEYNRRALVATDPAVKATNEALRDQIAINVFNARTWSDAKAAVDIYNDTVRAGAAAFGGNVEEMHKWEEATANLHNEFTKLKNNITLALEPVAHAWIDEIVEKLHEFGAWAQAHQEDLKRLFEGAAQVAGGVITVLEKIVELLGSQPALIEDVTMAFAGWEVISGITSLLRSLALIRIALAAMPAEAAEAGVGIAAGLSAAITAATLLATTLGTALAIKTAIDTANPAAGDPNRQIPKDQRSWWDTLKTWMSPGEQAVTDPNDPRNPHYKPPPGPAFPGMTPFGAIPGMEAPPEARNQPPGPGETVWGKPTTPEDHSEGAPGPGGMVWDGQGGLLTPEMFESQKKGRGGKGKLPEAPEIPYPPGFGGPPAPGESEQHYRDRMEVMQKQHELATDQARVDQLEKSNVATADEIQKAKNKVVQDGVQLNEAEMALNKAETGKLRKHSEELGQIGAKIDEDFGISKGLPGIAENLTKFLANLAFAPVEGAMMGAQAGLGYPGAKGSGSGMVGMIASAMGMAAPPQYPGMEGGEGGGGYGAGYGGIGYGAGKGGGSLGNIISQAVARQFAGPQGAGPAGFGGASGVEPGGINLSTIPIAAQQYANDCIDASARIILSHAGKNMSETQLESVIAPGGSIGSQAAGLNQLEPSGKFVAMAGSGGSQQAMFQAIKTSIDRGVGSVLNVAPGSSIAGKTFGEGHFIAATGYNPDGTINLSDTARGTRYTVSAADAYQATQGRGIVAGTGSPVPTWPGYDSGGAVPIIAHAGEHVFSADDVSAMGGQSAVYAFRNSLHYDDGGGVFGTIWGGGPGAPAPAAPAPSLPAPKPPPAPIGGPGVSPIAPLDQPNQFQRTMDYVWGKAGPAGPEQGGPPGQVGPFPVPPDVAAAAQGMPQPGAGPGQGVGPPSSQPLGGTLPGQEPIGGGEPMAMPGPGIGIGSGGILGLIESLPATAIQGAAGMFPGGGAAGSVASAALQIGIQEMNRAIGEAGQVAGIAVQGLQETFMPTGTSKLASDNWLTRIAAGISGAKPQLPNVAGQGAKAEEQSKGLTPEQLAAMPPGQQPGAGAGPGQNQPATPTVHIGSIQTADKPDAIAGAISSHQQAAANSVAITGTR